ncbi:MAG: hypothetical protein EA422_10030 [Gemmatimonadales bacterium]|nr:MAG: hypothetical protein EA422_10030 [Gemmatimonadales bacterium]
MCGRPGGAIRPGGMVLCKCMLGIALGVFAIPFLRPWHCLCPHLFPVRGGTAATGTPRIGGGCMRDMCGAGVGRWSGRVVVLVLAGVIAAGCSYVKQDDFNQELADIRAEMRAADQGVEERLNQRVDGVEARVEELEEALRGLAAEFAATVDRLEDAIRFNAPVHFAFDDATVRSQDRPLLDRFAEVVQAYYPDAFITVEGFTDSAGDPAYNMRLGQRRADSVREYLVNQGLAEDRSRAVSYGETRERQIVPGAVGPGDGGWQNRRVAMVIDFQGETRPGVVASSGDREER